MTNNHHYIPRCYQLGFTDPRPNPRFTADESPRIWQAELKSRKIRLRPTRKVGCAQGFYSLGCQDEVKNEAAERAHSQLEAAIAPVLRQLNNGQFQPATEDWENLLFFAAVLAMRGPSTKILLTDLRRRGDQVLWDLLANLPLDAFIQELEKTYPNMEISREQARKLQSKARLPRSFVPTSSNSTVILTSLKTAQETIFPLFLGMQWTYLHAPLARPFICSDFPVAWVDPSIPRSSRVGHGLEARHVEISFPIGRSIALLGHREPSPSDHLYLNDELVDQINLRSIEGARVEILGSTRESVEWGLALSSPPAL